MEGINAKITSPHSFNKMLKTHITFKNFLLIKSHLFLKENLVSPMAVVHRRKATAHHHPCIALADAAMWPCILILITLILFCSLHDEPAEGAVMRGPKFSDRPCDEFYVVSEGETLHSISDKCHDSFILEENPHIHDPDDVFPGLVIKITQTRTLNGGKN